MNEGAIILSNNNNKMSECVSNQFGLYCVSQFRTIHHLSGTTTTTYADEAALWGKLFACRRLCDQAAWTLGLMSQRDSIQTWGWIVVDVGPRDQEGKLMKWFKARWGGGGGRIRGVRSPNKRGLEPNWTNENDEHCNVRHGGKVEWWGPRLTPDSSHRERLRHTIETSKTLHPRHLPGLGVSRRVKGYMMGLVCLCEKQVELWFERLVSSSSSSHRWSLSSSSSSSRERKGRGEQGSMK